MPNELELCVVSAIIGALLGGAVAYTVTHKIDGTALANEKAAHASDMARINATAAQQLAAALAKGQVAEGKVASLTTQYEQEVANHAKDNLDYRAQLLAGTQRVRVHVTGCSGASASSKGATATAGTDAGAAYADLSPAVASGVYVVADAADNTASQLKALQAYVMELQADGYIQQSK